MADDVKGEGWTFEAWRVCPHCKGKGIEPEAPRTAGTGALVQSTVDRCEQCRHGKRPGYEPQSKMMTVDELRALLGLPPTDK
jgi:hypothetical protein